LFQEWLKAQSELEILAGAQAATDEAYWQAFVEEGYRKGAGRAFDDTRKASLPIGPEQEAFFAGTREEFLRSSFGRPVAVDKVKLLAGRVFTDLKGVTEVMNTKMTRILAEGLAQGQNPAEMASTMIKDGMGFTKTRGIQSRAMTIARTEIIRAHAEGQLDAMEDLGVTEVGVMVEWSTAGDDRVCPLCAPMEGVVLKIREARGIIPRHPNCRCAHIPANVGESTKGQKRGKAKIQEARDKSVGATIPQGRKIKGEGLRFQDPETGRFTLKSKRTLAEQKRRSSWAGADRTVAKVRPKARVKPQK
jgi:SPP1 gp7 family putative phage head morphogenesis protein